MTNHRLSEREGEDDYARKLEYRGFTGPRELGKAVVGPSTKVYPRRARPEEDVRIKLGVTPPPDLGEVNGFKMMQYAGRGVWEHPREGGWRVLSFGQDSRMWSPTMSFVGVDSGQRNVDLSHRWTFAAHLTSAGVGLRLVDGRDMVAVLPGPTGVYVYRFAPTGTGIELLHTHAIALGPVATVELRTKLVGTTLDVYLAGAYLFTHTNERLGATGTKHGLLSFGAGHYFPYFDLH